MTLERELLWLGWSGYGANDILLDPKIAGVARPTAWPRIGAPGRFRPMVLDSASAMIRYADDFVMVFSSREDALRVQEVLPKRLMRFGLTLHPEKTKLVEFRRPVDGDAGGEPRSFDFLGFTHHWGRSQKGNWAPMRKTSKRRSSRSIRAMNAWMRSVRHWKVVEQAKVLASKLRGHFNYYGLTGNSAGISRYHHEVTRLWF